MNTKILVPAVLVAGLSLAAVGTYAATSTTTTPGSTMNQTTRGPGFGKGGHMMANLTDAEKTALESMTDEQKKAWFETKRTEMEARHDAREAVIDKLLAGTALSATEETTRQEIIKERAERKAQKEKMDAIRAKVEAGTALTAEEQDLVDSMPRGGHGKGGKGFGMKSRTSTTAPATAQ
jgi:Spy/CpxP family protein refolding chaperone